MEVSAVDPAPEKRSILGYATLVAIALGFLYFIWPTPWETYRTGKSNATIQRSNRFTGEVQTLTSTGWVRYRTVPFQNPATGQIETVELDHEPAPEEMRAIMNEAAERTRRSRYNSGSE